MTKWKCVDCESVKESGKAPVCCTKEMKEYEKKHGTNCCCC